MRLCVCVYVMNTAPWKEVRTPEAAVTQSGHRDTNPLPEQQGLRTLNQPLNKVLLDCVSDLYGLPEASLMLKGKH